MNTAVMGINALEGIDRISGTSKTDTNFKLLSPDELKTKGKSGSFDSLLQSAMDMISETNRYSNEAAEAELAYAMGITNSTHELQVAQMKANVSLQYTVAVRNAVMDAYKEIMQMQF